MVTYNENMNIFLDLTILSSSNKNPKHIYRNIAFKKTIRKKQKVEKMENLKLYNIIKCRVANKSNCYYKRKIGVMSV